MLEGVHVYVDRQVCEAPNATIRIRSSSRFDVLYSPLSTRMRRPNVSPRVWLHSLLGRTLNPRRTERLRGSEIKRAQQRTINGESIPVTKDGCCEGAVDQTWEVERLKGHASGSCRLSERGLRVRGVTLSLVLGRYLLGVEFLAWSDEETWSLGWRRKDVQGSHAVIEENEPKETRVGSVSRGEDDILN